MMQALPDSTKYRLVRKRLDLSGRAPARLPVRRKEGRHMKCANESIRECGDGRWQVRFYYKNGDRWKVDPHSFKAISKRAARRRVDEIKEGLERAAQAEGSEERASLSEKDMTTEGFLCRLVGGLGGLVGFGQMERNTEAGYCASAEPASGHLAGKRVDELNGEMILDWQDRLSHLCGSRHPRSQEDGAPGTQGEGLPALDAVGLTEGGQNVEGKLKLPTYCVKTHI